MQIFKKCSTTCKSFYLSLLGQLILCCNIYAAEEILKGILVIARSETEGMTRNNERTLCATYKIQMKNLLVSSNQEIPIDDKTEFNNMLDIKETNINFIKWNQ